MKSTRSATTPEPFSDFASRWRQVKACARCHRLKMKCTYEDPGHKSCRRCFASGLHCSWDEDPTAERARKRARSNRKVETLIVSQLQQLLDVVDERGVAGDDVPRALNLLKSIEDKLGSAKSTKNGSDNTASPPDNAYPEISISDNLAHRLVKLGFVTKSELQTRFSFFLENILPYGPVVPFSAPQQQFSQQFESTPVLLLACVFATTINNNTSAMNISGGPEANRNLQTTLLHYLDTYLAKRIIFASNNFLLLLVTACLVLSLWCIVPSNGHHKNQIKLLLAYNVSLCMGLGDPSKHPSLPESARNELRNFLAVYCCCSSLGLSLPRFKLPTWSKDHENARRLLLELHEPPFSDICLGAVSGLVKVAHEGIEVLSQESAGYSPENTVLITEAYVTQMGSILSQCNIKLNGQLQVEPQGYPWEFLVSFIYYQALMNLYDNVVTAHTWLHCDPTDESLLLLILGQIVKLTTVCESLLSCFVALNNQSINYPTFFFYKPFHALIILIRLKLYMKTGIFNSSLANDNNASLYFDQVEAIMNENRSRWDLNICNNMSSVLSKVKWWLNVALKYHGRKVNPSDPSPHRLLNLIMSSKNKEIETLETPEPGLADDRLEEESLLEPALDKTIEEIFREMDLDLSTALNPFEASIDASEYLFNSPFA